MAVVLAARRGAARRGGGGRLGVSGVWTEWYGRSSRGGVKAIVHDMTGGAVWLVADTCGRGREGGLLKGMSEGKIICGDVFHVGPMV